MLILVDEISPFLRYARHIVEGSYLVPDNRSYWKFRAMMNSRGKHFYFEHFLTTVLDAYWKEYSKSRLAEDTPLSKQVFLKEISACNVTGLLWTASQTLLLDHSETAIYLHFSPEWGPLPFFPGSFPSSSPSRAPRSLILDAAFLKSNEACQNSIPQLLLPSHPQGKGGTGTQKWSIFPRVRTETSCPRTWLAFPLSSWCLSWVL